MEAAREEKDKRMPDMIRDLDTNIARLNEQLVQLGASLDEGLFVDESFFENPAPVLAELERVKQKLAAVDTLARQYSAYQALFGITVYRSARARPGGRAVPQAATVLGSERSSSDPLPQSA